MATAAALDEAAETGDTQFNAFDENVTNTLAGEGLEIASDSQSIKEHTS